jgi:hypothetical protein
VPNAIARNPQAEAIFANWNLTYRLEEEFPVDQIHDVVGQQVRFQEHIANKAMVEEYLEQYKNGAVFPPIVLRDPGTMIDGNTRRAMYAMAGAITVPAYLVQTPSLDLAKALGAALNQIGGQRLTPDEAMRAAVDMMSENLHFTDSQIAAAVGRAPHQVRVWRQQQLGVQHARRVEVQEEFARVPKTQHAVLARVVQDQPFAAAVRLASSHKVPNRELKALVDDMTQAPSEQDAVDLVSRAALDYRAHASGPGAQTVVRNKKAHRMRMLLPQILNLSPPDEVYEPDKADTDAEAWRQVARVAAAMLAMYDRMRGGTPTQA